MVDVTLNRLLVITNQAVMLSAMLIADVLVPLLPLNLHESNLRLIHGYFRALVLTTLTHEVLPSSPVIKLEVNVTELK